MSPIEIIAVIFGLACVWLAVKENIWNWPVGLVQVVLYIYIFWQAKLYSDAGLQVIYVGVQFYGWWYWLKGGKNKTEAPVTAITGRDALKWITVGIVGAAAWGHLMATKTDAACPYADAFVVAFSLVAQWLMAKKKLESWFFWTAVDVVAIGVYAYKDLYLTSGLYAVFLGMTIKGYFDWKKSLMAAKIQDLKEAWEASQHDPCVKMVNVGKDERFGVAIKNPNAISKKVFV